MIVYLFISGEDSRTFAHECTITPFVAVADTDVHVFRTVVADTDVHVFRTVVADTDVHVFRTVVADTDVHSCSF